MSLSRTPQPDTEIELDGLVDEEVEMTVMDDGDGVGNAEPPGRTRRQALCDRLVLAGLFGVVMALLSVILVFVALRATPRSPEAVASSTGSFVCNSTGCL